MLTWLLGSKSPRGRAVPDDWLPRVPPDTTVYAIGDVHGRLDLLENLEEQIVRDAARRATARNVVVYLGDYVDRGYDSLGVVEHLIDKPLKDFEQVYLKGNHEDFLLQFLDDQRVGPVWMANGGLETLMSYGVRLPHGQPQQERLAAAQAGLREALPARHLKFMRGLKLTHREGDYLFVHAGVRPGVAIEEQQPEDLIWIREEFLNDESFHDCIVVHGHTPMAVPQVMANRIGIDTGAFATGCLTSVALEGGAQDFLDT